MKIDILTLFPSMFDGFINESIIKRAIENNIPVVVVSRCFEGRVFESYGYEGGGKHLRDPPRPGCDL